MTNDKYLTRAESATVDQGGKIPNPKSQTNSKFKMPKIPNGEFVDATDLMVFGTLEFEILNLFGIWDFEFESAKHFCAPCAKVTA